MKFIQGLFALIMVIIMMALNLLWIAAGIALVAAIVFYLWPLLLTIVVGAMIIGFTTKLRKS